MKNGREMAKKKHRQETDEKTKQKCTKNVQKIYKSGKTIFCSYCFPKFDLTLADHLPEFSRFSAND